MIPAHVIGAVSEALHNLPAKMDTAQARVMLYAIGLQESRFTHRYQVLNTPGAKGPARGFWQFEKGGGCKGVVNHDASKYWMHGVCDDRGEPLRLRRSGWQSRMMTYWRQARLDCSCSRTAHDCLRLMTQTAHGHVTSGTGVRKPHRNMGCAVS